MGTFTDAQSDVMHGQSAVRLAVMLENRRQLEKWGVQSHLPSFWFLILAEEVGELAAAILAETDAEAMPPTHYALLKAADRLGVDAQTVLEGKLPNRINGVQDNHDSGKEAVHVAAVAIAMEESHRRNTR